MYIGYAQGVNILWGKALTTEASQALLGDGNHTHQKPRQHVDGHGTQKAK